VGEGGYARRCRELHFATWQKRVLTPFCHVARSVELVPRVKHMRRPMAGELSFAAFRCGMNSTLQMEHATCSTREQRGTRGHPWVGERARAAAGCFWMWLMASQTAVPDAAKGGATRKGPVGEFPSPFGTWVGRSDHRPPSIRQIPRSRTPLGVQVLCLVRQPGVFASLDPRLISVTPIGVGVLERPGRSKTTSREPGPTCPMYPPAGDPFTTNRTAGPRTTSPHNPP